MKKKNIEELKQSINQCIIKLHSIMPLLNDNKPVLNEKFNRILIEKAILREQLIQKQTPVFVKLLNRMVKKRKRAAYLRLF